MVDRLDETVIEAAGGVVERETSEGLWIGVIYRERYGPEWALPKGKRQTGESWQKAALREVQEETGLSPRITGIAGASAYLVRGVPKLVLYWRMRVEGSPPPFMPNDEVRQLEWLSPQKAMERLTHPEEVNIVRTATASNSPK